MEESVFKRIVLVLGIELGREVGGKDSGAGT
jgi:hypothetical protein